MAALSLPGWKMLEKMKQRIIEGLARRLPDCDTTTKTISNAMDEKISLWQRIQVKLHLLICIYCARYRDQILLLRTTVRKGMEADKAPPATSLSSEARDRMKRRLSGG